MQLHWNYLYICRNIFWQQFISIKVFLLPQVNWVSFSFLCQNACLAGISCFENTQLIIGKSHLLVLTSRNHQLVRYSFFLNKFWSKILKSFWDFLICGWSLNHFDPVPKALAKGSSTGSKWFKDHLQIKKSQNDLRIVLQNFVFISFWPVTKMEDA